jgi:hypothetical protein
MDTSLTNSITKLARGEILRVDNALGQSIAVVQGMLWITQEGDRRDTFLSDGDSFVFSRRGTALAQAVTDTKLLAFVGEAAEVIEPEPVAAADEHRTPAAHIRLLQDLAVYARMAQVPAHQVA